MGWAVKITKTGGQRDGATVSFVTVDDDFDFQRFVQQQGGLNVHKIELIRTRPEEAARLLFERAERGR